MALQNDPIFVRPARAVQAFGVHRSTLYRWAKDGHIKIYKRGGATFVKVSEVTKFIMGLGD
ncbi:helix-turn-helix domain-containing protein [Paracoccus sp. KR1-242]|uniref:helix-turn-helix domain-containing protein n=1 Tax=Paracoccus sp. KR1-242 TaxID=3410028 RepID=UPI003C09D31C